MERIKTDQAISLLGKCREHLAKDLPQEAVQEARDALELFQDVRHQVGEEEALDLLASAHLAKHEETEAAAVAREALALHQRAGNGKGQAAALQTLARVLIDTKSMQKALATVSDLLRLRRELGDEEGQTAALKLLATAHSKSAAVVTSKAAANDRALEALEDWLATVRGFGDAKGEVVALQAIVSYLLDDQICSSTGGAADLSRKACRFAAEASAICKTLGDTKRQIELNGALVRAHLARSDFDEALARVKEGVRLAAGGDADDRVGALLLKVHVHLRREEPEQALPSANRALAAARESDQKHGEVDSLFSLARVQSALGRPEEAAELVLSAADICRRFDDRQAAAALLALLAGGLLDFGRPGQALRVAEEAARLFGRAGESLGQAEALAGVVADAALAAGEADRSAAATEQALELFRSRGDRAGESRVLLSLARSRQAAGNSEGALQVAFELAQASVRSGQKVSEAAAQQLAAEVHCSNNEHQLALQRAAQAHDLFRELQDQHGQLAVLELLVRVRSSMKEPDTAQQHAEDACALCDALGERSRGARLRDVVVDFRLQKREFSEVVKAAKAAREACRRQGDSLGEAQEWHAIAKARLEQVRLACPTGVSSAAESQWEPATLRRLMEAFMAAKEALHLFQQAGDASGQAASLQAVAKAYRYKGQPLLAVEAAKESVAVYRATKDQLGAAQSLLLEATTQLLVAGSVWEAPLDQLEDSGEAGPPAGRPMAFKEALAAAEEARELCRGSQDPEFEEYAQQVLAAAQEGFRVAPHGRAPPPVGPRTLLAVDDRERKPLEDLGFKFAKQAEARDLLHVDVRLEALLRRSLEPPHPAAAKAAAPQAVGGQRDAAMERLLRVAQRANGQGRYVSL